MSERVEVSKIIQRCDKSQVKQAIGSADDFSDTMSLGRQGQWLPKGWATFSLCRVYMRSFTRQADRRNQKQRELLARDLKAFFRSAGAPIVLTDNRQSWRTAFAPMPDA